MQVEKRGIKNLNTKNRSGERHLQYQEKRMRIYCNEKVRKTCARMLALFVKWRWITSARPEILARVASEEK